jgi:hypothetical protein
MATEVVSFETSADGTEFNVLFESESREELLAGDLLRRAVKLAADCGFGLNCAITKTPPPYPVDNNGVPITYPPLQPTQIKYRRVISCGPRE